MVPEAATGETCKGSWKRVQWESPGLFRSNTVEARHRSTGPPRRCSLCSFLSRKERWTNGQDPNITVSFSVV
uniref:Uncharacterized protein n=1 Tax=Mus spicilegus TaxID=10103 RepID=A0A8C6GJB9_MUSSI